MHSHIPPSKSELCKLQSRNISQGDTRGTGGPDLSIIVPTYNEAHNIAPLEKRIRATLKEHRYQWEIIFVDDDSPDGTSQTAKALADNKADIRCLRRVGRRGLSTAVIEGVLSSSSQFVAVMDGDLQHDERLLSDMLETLARGQTDIVIASRYVPGGSASGLVAKNRQSKSLLGNWLANKVLTVNIGDPMSGFFMMRRRLFERYAQDLSGEGFKILLDLLISIKEPIIVTELPMNFRMRVNGNSKLDFSVELAFANLLIDKTIGRFIPLSFLSFAAIGSIGVLVHLVVLTLGLNFGLNFGTAQAGAALTAMTSNFMLNNSITFHDQRLVGWSFLRGLMSFYAICFFGLIANIGIAQLLFERDNIWWLSGIAGACAAAVWNYVVSTAFTWGHPRAVRE